MKSDIQNRKDINLFTTQFYDKLLSDKEIQHFFEAIIKNNTLESHLKIVADFWEDLLFQTLNYQKNAMKPHLFLNKTNPFQKKHFEIWLKHFNNTIDQHFTGTKADLAKTRALSIATVMQIKMQH
tara:strand:+ start:691810 stop:692184 length:375 start_codon:yes stop_codon:yes gene_type:complete